MKDKILKTSKKNFGGFLEGSNCSRCEPHGGIIFFAITKKFVYVGKILSLLFNHIESSNKLEIRENETRKGDKSTNI